MLSKRLHLGVAVAISLVAMLIATIKNAQALEVGDQAPRIECASWLNGEANLREQTGRVVVISFWATW